MKSALYILVIMTFLSCEKSNKKVMVSNFQEKELSFLHLRFGYDTSSKWIKKPENISMLHETFKKIGYENLISEEDWTSNWNWYLDVTKSPQNLIDSLELTYANFQDAPEYYRKFWQRRIAEKNDKIVYQVVKEINKIRNGGEKIEGNIKFINDTLFQLLSYEFPQRILTENESNDLLHYLIETGMHTSAYNLVSGENGQIWNEEWNEKKDGIIPLLDTSRIYQRPWFEDNTK